MVKKAKVSYKYDKDTRMRTFPRKSIKAAYGRLMKNQLLRMPNGCVITLRHPSSRRPYVGVNDQPDKAGTPYVSLVATKVVLMRHGKECPAPWYEASHICGMDRCVNADHLVWESASKNVSRDKCHRWGLIHKCKHVPRCVPFDENLAAIVTAERLRASKKN